MNETLFCEMCGEEMLVRKIRTSQAHTEILWQCPNCKNKEEEVIFKGGQKCPVQIAANS